MEDFNFVLMEVKAELTKRGMQHSSLVFNMLADRYRPSFKLASKDEQEQLLQKLNDYQSKSGLNMGFDWKASLS